MSRILMIDDNEIDHFIMRRMLERCNLFTDVEESLDGRVALKTIRENLIDEHLLPDVILLDVRMPDFSGFEFLEEFKQVLPLIKKDIDIYMVTASLSPFDKRESEKYAFVKGYLIKPIGNELLKELFREFQEKIAC